MKRKRDSDIRGTQKEISKMKRGNEIISATEDSKDATSKPTVCKYILKEKVIGFYGGWPYVGVVHAIDEIAMTFGAAFVLLIRWNGFSGKNAMTWTSEFDVVEYNEENIKLKDEMETSRREKLKAIGRKADIVQQRKVFNEVVKMFRGAKLAPFAPLTSPYPEEWQTVIRICAIPKLLVDHLALSETLIYSRKLVLTEEITTARTALEQWSQSDCDRNEYANTLVSLFNKYLVSTLLYKFEIQLVAKQIATQGCDYASMFSVEYLLRLLALLPQLLTATHQGVLFKGVAQVKPLFAFCELNQSFMRFLENNIETLFRRSVRMSTLEDPVPETYWMNTFHKSKEEDIKAIVAPLNKQEQSQGCLSIDKDRSFLRSKWKKRVPVCRPARPCM